MNLDNDKREVAEDIYEKLIDSQVSYLIFDDPMEQYTHLTDEEKEKVKAYVMDHSHLWDYAPIAEFITDNVPTTFQKDNYEKIGVTFDSGTYKYGGYKDSVAYKLYQYYLLNFEYGIGNTPVCYDEFVNNELQSEDYLDSVDGVEL